MKLSCLVVDDEPSGRKVLEEYISETGFLDLAGKAENPLKALALLEKVPVDLMFLDIQMPKLNGIDFLKMLKSPPLVIVSTAFPEYALQGFELDVVDYLVKPVSLERFLKAVHKARDFFERKTVQPGVTDHFFVKCNTKFEKVMYDELLYAEAANNYILLHTTTRRLIAYITFKGIEEHLPPQQFIKVHKSYIVSLNKIDSLDGETILIGRSIIPISRSMKEEVFNRIVNKNLVKR